MSARARVRGVFGSRGQLARTRNAPRTRYLGAAAPALRERTCAHCVRERNSCALFAFAGLRVALLSSPTGAEVEGYGSSVSVPLEGNSTSQTVAWYTHGSGTDHMTTQLPAGAAAAEMALKFMMVEDVQIFSFLLCHQGETCSDSDIATISL